MRDASLPNRHVDLWYTPSDEVRDPESLAEYRSWMSADEIQRHERFLFEHSKHQFLVTRGLVRWTLSQYFDVEPAAWQFTQNAYGKPAIVEPADCGASFNISHTAGMVVCAVAAGGQVGVDVEDIDRRTVGIELARRYFAPDEVAVLEQAAPEDQQSLFFQFWTLKESYIKAVGKGLSIPLDSFAFRLRDGEPPQITFTSRHEDEPAEWQFAQLQLGQRHQLAVALELPVGQRLVVQSRQTIPLRDMC